MPADSVRIIPLGGLGEVGKNMTVFEYRGRMVLLDAGLTFPHDDMLGIDIVLPDFSYVAERVGQLDAIVLTHAHEDHIGALPYLLREIGTDAEVWGTRFTLGLVKSKLDEHGLTPHVDLMEIKPEGGKVKVGPFMMEFMRVTHSVPDAVSVAFHTDFGPIIHTGDFKLDPTPIDNRPHRSGAARSARRCGRCAADVRLHQCRGAGIDGVRAHRGCLATRDHPLRAGPRDRHGVLIPRPPAAAGGRCRGRERPRGGDRRALDEPQLQHRAEPGLRRGARRRDHQAASPRRVHAPSDRGHLHRQPGRADVGPHAHRRRHPPGAADPLDRHGRDLGQGDPRQRGQGQ